MPQRVATVMPSAPKTDQHMVESKEPQRWGAEALGTRNPTNEQTSWYNQTLRPRSANSSVRRYGFTEVIGKNVAHAWQSTASNGITMPLIYVGGCVAASIDRR